MGVPTANIEPDSQFKLIPAKGVYAVVVRFDDKEFGGVMNIGTNPTVTDDISLKLEVNILILMKIFMARRFMYHLLNIFALKRSSLR